MNITNLNLELNKFYLKDYNLNKIYSGDFIIKKDAYDKLKEKNYTISFKFAKTSSFNIEFPLLDIEHFGINLIEYYSLNDKIYSLIVNRAASQYFCFDEYLFYYNFFCLDFNNSENKFSKFVKISQKEIDKITFSIKEIDIENFKKLFILKKDFCKIQKINDLYFIKFIDLIYFKIIKKLKKGIDLRSNWKYKTNNFPHLYFISNKGILNEINRNTFLNNPMLEIYCKKYKNDNKKIFLFKGHYENERNFTSTVAQVQDCIH